MFYFTHTACMIGKTVMTQAMRHIIYISHVVNGGFILQLNVDTCPLLVAMSVLLELGGLCG